MVSLFDDETGIFVVLVNEESQHSLWSTKIDVPIGWTVRFGPAERNKCLDYVNSNWTDMRPRSLIAATDQSGC